MKLHSKNILIIILFMFALIALNQSVNAQSGSRIELITINSSALGIFKNFNIYLPEGYEENVDERYPVVYLFRGHEREWVNRNEDAHRKRNRTARVGDFGRPGDEPDDGRGHWRGYLL